MIALNSLANLYKKKEQKNLVVSPIQTFRRCRALRIRDRLHAQLYNMRARFPRPTSDPARLPVLGFAIYEYTRSCTAHVREAHIQTTTLANSVVGMPRGASRKCANGIFFSFKNWRRLLCRMRALESRHAGSFVYG